MKGGGVIKAMSEIGGDYHIPLSHLWGKNSGQHDAFLPKGTTNLLMFNGRAVLRLILRSILKLGENDEVLLPAYLFDGLLEPFRESKVTIRFYKLNMDLTLDAEDIKKKVNENTKVLLIMHYFGFPQPVNQLREFRENNPSVMVIEDIVQSFLTSRLDKSLGTFGDFAFNCYMKFVPTPDGSLLIINRPVGDLNWSSEQVKRPASAWARYAAMNFKNLYINTKLVPKSLYLRLFRYAARQLEEYSTFAPISWNAKRIINSFDYDSAIATRRRNFQYLLDNWNSNSIVPFYPALPSSVCPMGFVVCAEDRDYVRKQLIKARIYCPVHWPTTGNNPREFLPGEIATDEFANSWEISKKILMIPIDHRYGIKEMKYILEKIGELP